MIITIADMYRSFLEGIKKVSTTVVTPTVFNSLINEAMNNVVMSLVSVGEVMTKPIDDLECLREITDGMVESKFFTPTAVLHPIAPDISAGKVFTLPKDENININSFDGTTVTQKKYPRLLRTLGIEFKIRYKDNVCGKKGVSSWLSSNIMRSDNEQSWKKSPYRRPQDDRLYFHMRQGKVVLMTGSNAEGVAMKIDYYRYPKKLVFDPQQPLNVSEFNPQFNQWIVDDAVRMHIERVMSQRYQTVTAETQIKQVNKVS